MENFIDNNIEEDIDDRLEFSAFDLLLVEKMPLDLRSSLPASNWLNDDYMYVLASESGVSGGLDVWDVVNNKGEDVSVYGTQIIDVIHLSKIRLLNT